MFKLTEKWQIYKQRSRKLKIEQQNLTKTDGELRCFGRVSSSYGFIIKENDIPTL
jgi:hypothetical protein